MLLKKLKSSLRFAVLCASVGFIGTPVFADTSIRAVVCSNDSRPSVLIVSPQSDAVISRRDIVLSVATKHVGQITVFVDNAYDRTIALEPGQTQLKTNLTLENGTRTIKIVASGICGDETANASTIITVDSTAPPTAPTETPPETSIFDGDTVTESGRKIVTQTSPLISRNRALPYKTGLRDTNMSVTDLSPRQIGSISNFDAILGVPKTPIGPALAQTFWVAIFVTSLSGLLFSQAFLHARLLHRFAFSVSQFRLLSTVVMLIALILAGAS